MPVDTVHRSAKAQELAWARCRDAAGGSDAVKAKGTTYLPALEGMTVTGLSTSGSAYEGYKTRALYYPATGRTVTGLTGLVFGKPPTVTNVPVAQQPDFSDVTLTGVGLAGLAVHLCREVLITGRVGTLIDFPDVVTSGARPYWVTYPAEAIVNWRTTRLGGRQVLTLLVLAETRDEPTDDPFKADVIRQYRVLQLLPTTTGYACTVTVYREDPEHKGTFLAGQPRVPLRRGVPLPVIPFVFLGPSGITPDVEDPPLLALADVNLSHYRTSADREHGAHFTALPTPYITGHTLGTGETLSIGSGNAWVLPNPQATAGMVEFTGAGLASLKDLMEEKRQLMATLGARMLETQKNVQEAAETVRLRHAGESSAMSILADALGQALTQAVRWHLWWGGIEETTANKAAVTMNPEVLDQLSADDMKALVTSWQAGAISHKTVLANLAWGEWLAPGTTIEQELEDIKRENDNLNLPKPLPGAA